MPGKFLTTDSNIQVVIILELWLLANFFLSLQESISETATFLLCYLGFRFVRSYGIVLSYDGFPSLVRFLNEAVMQG